MIAAPGIHVTAVLDPGDGEREIEDLLESLNVIHPGHAWAVTRVDYAVEHPIVTVHGTPLAFWPTPRQRLITAAVAAIVALVAFTIALT